MFYLGLSNFCPSAELCLMTLLSFWFYMFLAKKEDLWKFTKVRPDYNPSSKRELTTLDRHITTQAFQSFYGDIIEFSNLYLDWFLIPDAEEQIIEHIQSVIDKDKSRVERRKFLEREVTERSLWLFKGYKDPKDAWYYS